MITLTGVDQDRLAITLTDEPESVAAVFRSLLNVRENRNHTGFFITVHDFHILCEKLDQLGITQATGRREMDDAAAEMIRSYRAELDRNVRIKAGELNDEIVGDLAVLKSTLWTDQVSDVRFCLRHPKVGIWNDLGTGKTGVALATFAVLKNRGLAKHALVICPNSVKPNWSRQTSQHTNLTAAELGNGRANVLREIKEEAKNRSDVLIVHYEALRTDEIRNRLIDLTQDVVIIDELHRAKHFTSQVTRAVFDLVSRIRPTVALVDAEVELPDGTTTTAVIPAGARPGDEVEFF